MTQAPQHGGVVVDQVAPGSGAEKSGLKPGLRIVLVGPQRVFSKAEFDILLLRVGGGRTGALPLGILRDGKFEVLNLVTSASQP